VTRRSVPRAGLFVGLHRQHGSERGDQQTQQKQHIHFVPLSVSAWTRLVDRSAVVGEHGLDPRFDLRGAHAAGAPHRRPRGDRRRRNHRGCGHARPTFSSCLRCRHIRLVCTPRHSDVTRFIFSVVTVVHHWHRRCQPVSGAAQLASSTTPSRADGWGVPRPAAAAHRGNCPVTAMR